MRRFLAVLALCHLGLLAVPSAEATTFHLKSLPDMVAHADEILQGRVINARAVEDHRGQIYTEYQIEVSDWMKSGRPAPGRSIVIKQLGGIIGDRGVYAEGIAHFEVGQEVLLFTKDYSGHGRVQVANLSQGALTIADEASDAAPGRSGQAPGRNLRGTGSFVGGAPERLDDFKAAVRALVAEVRP